MCRWWCSRGALMVVDWWCAGSGGVVVVCWWWRVGSGFGGEGASVGVPPKMSDR